MDSSNRDYFEGTLQLRNPTEEVYKFLANQFKKNPKYWIAKKTMVKNGCDLLISSNRFLMALGRKLKKSFPNGELKLSKKLFSVSRQTSKEVYRGTVLFRLPEEPKE